MQIGDKVEINTNGTITAMGLEGTEQKLIYRIKTDKGNLCFVEQSELVQKGEEDVVITNS